MDGLKEELVQLKLLRSEVASPECPHSQLSVTSLSQNSHPCPVIANQPHRETSQIRIVAPLFNRKATQRQPQEKSLKQFTPLLASYGVIFPYLIRHHLIAVIPMRPFQPPYPKWYNPNVSCAFHNENSRHSIEDCGLFKKRVQALIDVGLFDPVTI